MHNCIEELPTNVLDQQNHLRDGCREKMDNAALPFLYGIRNYFTLISFLDFLFNILSLKMIVLAESTGIRI